MTVIACFSDDREIIFAADRLITSPGGLREITYQNKIIKINNVFIGCSGALKTFEEVFSNPNIFNGYIDETYSGFSEFVSELKKNIKLNNEKLSDLDSARFLITCGRNVFALFVPEFTFYKIYKHSISIGYESDYVSGILDAVYNLHAGTLKEKIIKAMEIVFNNMPLVKTETGQPDIISIPRIK